MNDTERRQQLLSRARSLQPQLVRWRRHMHRHPELGHEEVETTAYVGDHLRALGLEPVLADDPVGLFVDVDPPGAADDPRIALRCDMDALPMPDDKDVRYRSTVEGVSHACGHDAHTAMLMGVAELLQEHREALPGGVRLIFQPAEEKNPGGATTMLERGVMENVAAILALHVAPELPTGHFGLRAGVLTASVAAFSITITGEGGHTARPHQSVDPIQAAAQLVRQISLVVPRRLDPLDPTIIAIGEIHGGHAPNVIPSRVRLRGTVRSTSQRHMDRVPELLRGLCEDAVSTWGGAYDFEYRPGSGPVINDSALIHRARGVVSWLLGADHVHWIDRPSMGGEDFAFYLSHAPGAMLRLGCTAPGASALDLHTGAFDMDEKALWRGVALLAGMALALGDSQISPSHVPGSAPS